MFVRLAPMDTWTGDGRRLASAGRGVRPLPFSIFAQFLNGGHEGAVLVGALHEVTFDEGKATGKGWLLDDENGHKLVAYRLAGALSRNSVDLADVKVNYLFEEHEDADGFSYEIKLDIVEWAIGATTFVPIPAFKDEGFDLGEITAAMIMDESVLDFDLDTSITLPKVASEELVASGLALPDWADFHQPEPDQPQKGSINADLTVTGHLCLWDACHDGIESSCVIPPRPTDGYASFNAPGVLTDQGMVETGPIFLAGGHRSAPDGDFEKAYGGIENAWGDVRIIPGKFGPWMSGRVRPGVTEEQIYAARASRLSGHWKGGRLKAIVSVNVPGYEVPGSGMFTIRDGFVDEMVAGFPGCMDSQPHAAEPPTEVVEAAQADDWDADMIALELDIEIAEAEAAG